MAQRAGNLVVVVHRRTGAVCLKASTRLNTRKFVDPTNPRLRAPLRVRQLYLAHLYESREDPPAGSILFFKEWAELQGVPKGDLHLLMGNVVAPNTEGAVKVSAAVSRGFVPLPRSASDRVALEVSLYQRKLNNRLYMYIERATSPTVFMSH